MNLLKNKNLFGIILMIASMAAFAIADALVKQSTKVMAQPQIVLLLMGGALVLFIALAMIQGDRLIDKRAFTPILWLRYAAEITGMIGMVNALAHVDLSVVGAVSQATPIFVALCAVVFLGEKISWRRWSSIICGFLGVLLIVRPGAAGFEVTILWTIVAMVGLGIRDLTTALTPKGMATSALAAYTMIAVLPIAVVWTRWEGVPLIADDLNYLVVVPMVLFGTIAYLLLIASIRIAPISVVMPFRYSRVLFLLCIGAVFFGERPDSLTLLGAALVVSSGLYIWWREKQVKPSH